MHFQLPPIKQWLNQSALQRLNDAYQAAQGIKTLESIHYNGEPIGFDPAKGKIASDYFCTLRDRELTKARFNLAQFRLSRLVVTNTADESEIIGKMEFIEAVLGKYRNLPDEDLFVTSSQTDVDSTPQNSSSPSDANSTHEKTAKPNPLIPLNGLQPSFRLGPLKLGQELTPGYEQTVVQELRLRRKQSQIALRWFVILLVVPLLVQTASKHLVFDPLLGNYSDRNPTKVELSNEIKESFIDHLSMAKEEMEVMELLGLAPEMTEEEKHEQLHETAVDLWRESRNEALNGLKNVLADGVSLLIFIGLVFFNRDKLRILGSVSNRTFLGLADPTKVFLFILITDMFVGFHSAEGWEVILESIFHHFGVPESKVVINGFIATVPVIIDSCIKFWIFSYLTRYSPSASAILERMNT